MGLALTHAVDGRTSRHVRCKATMWICSRPVRRALATAPLPDVSRVSSDALRRAQLQARLQMGFPGLTSLRQAVHPPGQTLSG
jgi:hypothetical protein